MDIDTGRSLSGRATRPADEAAISVASSPEASIPNAWQPIDTAPKDRVVLLYVPDMGNWPDDPAIVTAIWGDGQGWVDNGMAHCATYGHPTHWMPLPEPPQSERTGA
jgi:hypothetical protein